MSLVDHFMKYTIGHPAYDGANRYAEFTSPEGVYVELIDRDVPEAEAYKAKDQLVKGWTTFVSVWTYGGRDVIEVRAYAE